MIPLQTPLAGELVEETAADPARSVVAWRLNGCVVVRNERLLRAGVGLCDLDEAEELCWCVQGACGCEDDACRLECG